MCYIAAVLLLLTPFCVGEACGESFLLESDATGETYGPFEFQDGEKVVIGKSSFTLVKDDKSVEGTGWRESLDGVAVPSAAVSGLVLGDDFEVENVYVQNGILHLRQGEGFPADRELTVCMFLKEGASLDRRRFSVESDNWSLPNIHFRYKTEGKRSIGVEMYSSGYAMRLQFGKVKDGKVPGKIYLCLPDDQKSYVAGSFVAEIKD